MGSNQILSIAIGLILFIIIGTQITPSYIENIKVAKMENVTLINQEYIKEAISRYIKLEGKIPTKIDDLVLNGFIDKEFTKNSYNNDYEWIIIKDKGILQIKNIMENDENVINYFKNSLSNNNLPNCVELDNNKISCTTQYLLPDVVFNILKNL